MCNGYVRVTWILTVVVVEHNVAVVYHPLQDYRPDNDAHL
jgi:hypothetical protein